LATTLVVAISAIDSWSSCKEKGEFVKIVFTFPSTLTR
jgi:hypothetical protein